jgi:hypothetical protein
MDKIDADGSGSVPILWWSSRFRKDAPQIVSVPSREIRRRTMPQAAEGTQTALTNEWQIGENGTSAKLALIHFPQ